MPPTMSIWKAFLAVCRERIPFDNFLRWGSTRRWIGLVFQAVRSI